MKRYITLLLALVLCIGLCGCQMTEENGGSTGTTESTGTDTTTGTGATEGDSAQIGSTESSEAPTETPTQAPTEAPVTGGDGEITYILNTNSKKYHDPDCGSAKKISEKNREETTLSKEELEALGYKPCGTCKP